LHTTVCSLKFGEVLGEGAFGIVMKAEAYGLNGCDGSTVVAVKMLKGNHSLQNAYRYCFHTDYAVNSNLYKKCLYIQHFSLYTDGEDL